MERLLHAKARKERDTSADPRTCVYFNHGPGPDCELRDYPENRYCDGPCRDYRPDVEYIADKREDERNAASNTEPCFLSTACVDALGKEDDCCELTTLRRFRDEWLAEQEGGKGDIARYYAFAPSVIAQIDRLPGRIKIYEGIYTDLVAPCVKLIEEGRMEETWALYKEYTENLISEYAVEVA